MSFPLLTKLLLIFFLLIKKSFKNTNRAAHKNVKNGYSKTQVT